MNNEVRIALAVAGGYLLGRRQKLRLAMALAAAGATGRLSAGQSDLLQQGLKILSSSPELAKITESVRGDLVDASKAAAKAAVSRQVDSLSTRLHDRAESLRNPLEDLGLGEELEEDEEPKGRRGRVKGLLSRRKARRRDEEEDEYEPEIDEEEQEDEEEEEEAPPVRRRPASAKRRAPAAKPTRRAPRDSDEEEDEEEEEEEPRARSKRRPPSRSGSTASRTKPAPARARR
ncbi:hypothetical protein [Streptosporangium sp. NBC_01469]|uniref:hypothetical protein n=1 Tax=Streptosporangium sp. NBC_01469 TaxID=2903898 RepID=UPI002E2E08F3|nr:hypothetical protein [Streptosporangium sp. NBC_01469]